MSVSLNCCRTKHHEGPNGIHACILHECAWDDLEHVCDSTERAHLDACHHTSACTKHTFQPGLGAAGHRRTAPLIVAHSLANAAVAGVLLALHGTLTITPLSSIPVVLLAHFVSLISLDVWLVVYIGLTTCVHLVWLRVCFYGTCNLAQC
jgi:hypothetical protein